MSRSLVSRAVAVTVLSGVAIVGGTGVAHAATPASAVGADKATNVKMVIANSTDQTLNLTSASDSGTWQQRPTDLAPHSSETVTNYSAGNASINLGYTGSNTGGSFAFTASTPLIGHNSAHGSTNVGGYQVQTNTGSGYHPTDTYTVTQGQTFNYTGGTQTYVVPAGVTTLGVTAAGGAGGGSEGGALVSGTLAVTPGEVLTVGAAGNGGLSGGSGWGLSTGSTNYGGGVGATNNSNSGASYGSGGGGATVVQDASGAPIVIAGGGGGDDSCQAFPSTPMYIYDGGQGGYNGSLTGQNGEDGGQAGAASTSQGESAASNGGAAGGGGLLGGLAASNPCGGGGAGSSYDAGLTNPTVSTAPTSVSGDSAAGQVVLTVLS